MDEAVLEAARAVRPYLVDFVGLERAVRLDTKLAGLLAAAARGDDVESAVEAALVADEATGAFLERVRADAPLLRPPAVVSALTTRSYDSLPGQPSPVSADKFRCPHGDYVWYRMEVGLSVPQCPTHQCPLERA
jgi:hypothetical protein